MALRRVVSLPLVLLLLAPASAPAQQRRYLVELGAAGALTALDDTTGYGTGYGGTGRLGLWLPLRFSLEGELSYVRAKPQAGGDAVGVTSVGGSLLYNIPLSERNFFHLRAGLGSISYGECAPQSTPGAGACGSAGTWSAGAGFRIGITPTLLVRADGTVQRNISSSDAFGQRKFSNFGGTLGLSLMLGSKALVDADGDGVIDADDDCPGTRAGALVNRKGCPTDADNDGVADGIDRCPATPAGVRTGENGCPLDEDNDAIPDGIDRCPGTPAGAAVNAFGCSSDADRDQVPDGLDRCPDTPPGATVDALGCPNDTDGDEVLDGLDRCPDTPPATRVDREGCPSDGARPQKRPAPPPAPPPAPAPAPTPAAAPRPVVLRDAAFALGSARLRAEAYPVLDSIANVLLATSALRVEVGAHTASSRSQTDSRQLATLRIEAVRSYLINKGIRPQQLVPKFYGATAPITSDTTVTGRATNRRIEITPLPTGP
ncbi:MAG TPA: OmpA family protein [Gemmatimonadales bacterium]|nr:OmpA family protein [Gemmatimonadales bacterium]